MKRHFLLLFGVLLVYATVIFCPALVLGDETFLEPLEGWRILIDPGIGREVFKGPFVEEAKGPKGLSEPKVNLNVAMFLAGFLEQAGAEVALSREAGDPLPSLDERLKTAAKFEANLILSIHHDYNKDPKINFAKTYYYPPDEKPDVSIAEHMTKSLSGELDIPGKGPEAFSFLLLTRSELPCVMISCGCISNPEYEKKLEALEFNRQEAIALLKGMMAFQQDLTDRKVSKPPLLIHSRKEPVQVKQTSSRFPTLPETQAPMPLPKPLEKSKTTKTTTTAMPTKHFSPPLLNPVGDPFDQSWLYGESWGELPVRKGVSFSAPAGTAVKAAANGVVAEASSSPPAAAPEYPNCVIIKHYNLIPEVPTMFTVYGNLADFKVKKGDRVNRGDVIGTTGAPSTASSPSRDTEFHFQIRWGNINEGCIVNPELFTEHTSANTGIIIGKLVDEAGDFIPLVRIEGAKKDPSLERYSYSLTYAQSVPSSELYEENFVISDLVSGEHILTSEYGVRRATVEPGKITMVTWQAK